MAGQRRWPTRSPDPRNGSGVDVSDTREEPMVRSTGGVLLRAAAAAGGLVAGCSGGPAPWTDRAYDGGPPLAPAEVVSTTPEHPTLAYWTWLNAVPARM